MSDIVPIEKITSKIYVIRDTRVMLDRDLAELYGVKTKALKQAVLRNITRFPEDFMFELTKEESRSLRSQNVTLKRGQHLKYLPYAFTEQGVAMPSSVLRSPKAIAVNIEIMRTFARMRKLAFSNEKLARIHCRNHRSHSPAHGTTTPKCEKTDWIRSVEG